ncbi:LysM peptidoglycan-binding domain-containing protein [Candidatus Roizmanbacteria bacterium]|nr:LysM peptidoglycan-binding domain-containing protein [Candidatus Roizmanbacteria bacterium]
MKKKDIVIDYRTLLISTVKERSLSLAIGVALITIILSIGFSLVISKIKSRLPIIREKEKVEEKAKEVSSKQKVQTYIVKEGDQLYFIAQKFYGSGLNMEEIIKANNIINPDLIEVGQVLVIPEIKSK